MKYHLTEALQRRDDLSDWKCRLLIHVLAHMKDKNVEELLGKRPFIADVVLTVNGHEVPFDSFMTHLQKQYERAVFDQARELVRERANSLLRGLHDGVHELETHIKAKVKDLFPGELDD